MSVYLQRWTPAFAALALLTLASACATEPVTPGADGDLSLDEAVTLATALGLQTLEVGRNPGSVARPAPAPQAGETVAVDYDFTRPCLRGGSVRSSGKIRVETDPGPPERTVADVQATEVHNACVFLVGDTDIAVTGDPSVTSTVHAASLAQRAWGPQTVSVVGGFSWVADDGRSGRCDLDIWVSADDDAGVHTTRGSICGHTFDVTVNKG